MYNFVYNFFGFNSSLIKWLWNPALVKVNTKQKAYSCNKLS